MDRRARELSASDFLDAGDHVGWVVRDRDEFTLLATRYLEQGAELGDKLFLFASPRGPEWTSLAGDGVTVLDPVQAFLDGGELGTELTFATFREQNRLARAQGYRGMRVVAVMDWLLDVPATFARIVDFEQRLDRLVAETGCVIVCAYRPESFGAVDLADVLCVHPHRRGGQPKAGSFRIWNVGGDRWRLAGDIDVNNVDTFSARLASAASGGGRLALDLREVGFVDLAGLRTIARHSTEQQVAIVVEGLGEAMRKCWNLLDLDAVAPAVELKA